MEDRDYQRLVWRLEAVARTHPQSFRAAVVLISMAAYVLIFALLAIMLILSWWLFSWAYETQRWISIIGAIGWILTVLPASFLTLRMFFTRIEAPTGRPITQEEAPRLFELIKQSRQRLHAPPIHQVLVTNDFNAAISQRPRFGLFGGHRNYLILGLPYLYAMTAQEIFAVIAHEYGHLTGNHGKLGAWIYRQRRTFGALQEHARTRSDEDVVNGIFSSLLDSFAPYYNAYTFVLSRQNEYEADQTASELAGAEANATGLIRGALLSDWLHRQFWPRHYAQAKQHPAPAFMPYAAMCRIFAVSHSEWATPARLQNAWDVNSDVHDTHPCLRERVSAMGLHDELPSAVKVSAADALLGECALTLAQEFDQAWWDEKKAGWQDYHRRYARCTKLEQLPMTSLGAADLQELAFLLFDLRSPGAAKPVLEHLLNQPGGPYSKPMYFYGRILLNEENTQGLDYLVKASKLSPSLWEDCARAGYQWLVEKRGETAAKQWLERMQR